MWLDNQPIEREWAGGAIKIQEILLEFDGPVVFVASIGFKSFLFAKRDELDHADFYLAAEANSETVRALREGRLSLRGALYQDEAWLIEASLPDVFGYQHITSEYIARILPPARAGIFSKFGNVPDTIEQADALFAFRFIGPGIRRGHVPLTILKEKIDYFSTFVRKALTPDLLNAGRDYRFFDVQMAEPRFTSLVLAAKRPEFYLEAMRDTRRLQNVDLQDLNSEIGQRSNVFWENLETLTSEIEIDGRVSDNLIAGQRLFLESLEGLVPDLDNIDIDEVEISYNDGRQIRTRTINKEAGEQIYEAIDRSQEIQRTVVGTITEINGDSKTFLIKDAGDRQTTVIIPWAYFDEIDGDGRLRRGKSVSITGQFTRRARRDRIWSPNPIRFLN